jgi:hypothetical protein
MIKNFFEGETDFTKQLADNRYWFRKLYDACGIESNGEIETYIEKKIDGGRLDIFEGIVSTVVEAQLGDLNLDHIHRASDYALCVDIQTTDHQADNVILLIDGNLNYLEREKIRELNQGDRNYFVVSVYPHMNSEGVLDLHFTLLLGPEKIKKRVFTKPKNNGSSLISGLDLVSNYRPSEPWRGLESLEKIRGKMFHGSVGDVEKKPYWLMYVGNGKWVSSGGHYNSSLNSCMARIRTEKYLELYGEPHAHNMNAWLFHKDENGMTIDYVLKQS